jgi:hypothetical protein
MNNKKTFILVLLSLGVFCLLELFYPPKHHSPYFYHNIPAFHAIFGLLGCLLLVAISKLLGKKWLWRSITSVPLPHRAFPEGQTLAIVRRWFVKEGDRVEHGQNLVEVSIGDSMLTIASPQAGTVMVRLMGETDIVQPGEMLLNLSVPKEEVQEQVDDKVIIHV